MGDKNVAWMQISMHKIVKESHLEKSLKTHFGYFLPLSFI